MSEKYICLFLSRYFILNKWNKVPVFQQRKTLQLGRSIFVFKFNHKHYFVLFQIYCHLTTMKSTIT